MAPKCTIITASTIYFIRIAMQEVRNSFTITYAGNSHTHTATTGNEATAPSLDCRGGIPVDVAEMRLSQGKQKMLQTFKSTILEQASGFHSQLKQSGMQYYQPSETRTIPSQIQQDSNQSEEKTVRQSLTPSKPAHPDPQDSPRFNRSSSLSVNQYTSFPQRTALLVSVSSLESQRQQLVDSINLAITFLCKGVLVRKYCFHRFKVETVVLSFSEDFQFVGVFVVEKKRMRVYPMSQFVTLQKGAKSWRFGEYLKRGEQVDARLCLSLTFKERSLDLLAGSEQERDRIVRDFQVLHESA